MNNYDCVFKICRATTRVHHLRDLMPDMHVDPNGAAQWMLSKVCANLGEAKLWPVKLATVRHSESLGTTACSHQDIGAQGLDNYCFLHACCGSAIP